jgi:hypothetical protein
MDIIVVLFHRSLVHSRISGMHHPLPSPGSPDATHDLDSISDLPVPTNTESVPPLYGSSKPSSKCKEESQNLQDLRAEYLGFRDSRRVV